MLVEIDFDQEGEFMVSCGEDKNWMIWRVQEQTFESKGMITGHHSRSIYSCSWSKGTVPDANGVQQQTDLIATVNYPMSNLYREVQITKSWSMRSTENP